jgi:hypothetical protein
LRRIRMPILIVMFNNFGYLSMNAAFRHISRRLGCGRAFVGTSIVPSQTICGCARLRWLRERWRTKEVRASPNAG